MAEYGNDLDLIGYGHDEQSNHRKELAHLPLSRDFLVKIEQCFVQSDVQDFVELFETTN